MPQMTYTIENCAKHNVFFQQPLHMNITSNLAQKQILKIDKTKNRQVTHNFKAV